MINLKHSSLRDRSRVVFSAAWCALACLLVCVSPAVAQPAEVLTATATSQRIKTAPGDQFAVAIVLNLEEGWHIWPNKPVVPKGVEGLVPTPTKVKLAKDIAVPAGVTVHVDRTQWPAPHEIESAGFTGEPLKVLSHSGRVVLYVPVTIAPDAKPGEVVIGFDVSYQACDDSICIMPSTAETSVKFQVGAAEGSIETVTDEAIFKEFQASVFAEILGGAPPPPAPDEDEPAPAPSAAADAAPAPSLFGYELPDPRRGVGLPILFLVSMLGGALMNLTPCVLPVIPIKIMTLTQHAGASHSALRLGLWMAMGIVVFWTAIGIPMAFISSALDPSRSIFGVWWVGFGIGVVIVIMGLGIMGMFNITLPQAVYKVNPKADTAWGSFVFGIMTAVLGLPCFGFVAGGLLAAAAQWPAITTMSVFMGIGIGMAAPFVALAAKPELVRKMPRTGPASELVKQVMGLLLLAAAAFFIAGALRTLVDTKPWLVKSMEYWAAAFFLTLASLWLVVRTFQISRKAWARVGFTLAAVLVTTGIIAFAASDSAIEKENYLKLQAAEGHSDGFVTGAWNHYTPARFEKARAARKIVVLDFTANWCLICKTLKRTVLNRDPVQSEIMKDDVVVFEVDLSAKDAPGWLLLRELGRVGIPTLAVFAPGAEGPQVFNAYTSATVMDAMQRAREGSIAANPTE